MAGWPCDHPLAAADTVKAPLRGLISMGAYKFVPALGEPDNSLDTVRAKPGLLQGIVILATWRSLEPTPTSGLVDNNEIDQGLANVRKYNQDYPNAPLAVKMRVWGGFWAPDWVMQDSGGKIPVVHTNFRGVAKDRALGHVWDDKYHWQWAHLQELLAAKYDSDPLVHEVAVTSCMMFTAEPFNVDSRPPALDPLRKAGPDRREIPGLPEQDRRRLRALEDGTFRDAAQPVQGHRRRQTEARPGLHAVVDGGLPKTWRRALCLGQSQSRRAGKSRPR